MPLLLSPDEIAARRAAASGPLAPLADGLAAELAPLLEGEPFIPEEKAQLTRAGGRCPHDGAQLEFDPYSPQAHRCPRCGRTIHGAPHYRMWIMWYQLWLAERAVHAALLHLLRGDPRHEALATNVLGRYAGMYETYPNRDNALGPARPFFSTYLESIWLLQLCVALDLLEMAGAGGTVSGAVRDRLIAPSRALIFSFDEGGSNRQVWNAAALLASSLLLGDERGAADAVLGRSSIRTQLESGMLEDGSWYEGENYHQFAHRGLWYGVTMAELSGRALPARLTARFQEGFASPFLVALPDLTLPSRRDSQYAISLRQWRYAEAAELGLARADDPRLTGALHRLYRDDIARRPTGRDRSAAESERNVPASALGRADLGWRSLLRARPELPELAPHSGRSRLLESQGLAILRREAGRIWIALDYGHSGGGHGHPDRLDLLLAADDVRWLDDMGTDSYVDRSLHWYRSTLAHNAPLVDGRSQQRVHGRLLAWEERGGAGWVCAEVEGIAPGVVVERAIIALPDYLLDVVRWRADQEVTLDLPIHLDGEMLGVTHWRDQRLEGGAGLEDGFDFVYDSARAERGPNGIVCLRSMEAGERMDAHVYAPGAEWWRGSAPGAPGKGDREFFLVRRRGTEGEIIGAWSWRGVVAALSVEDEVIVVKRTDGAVHRHMSNDDVWRIALEAGDSRSSIDLDGRRDVPLTVPRAPMRTGSPVETASRARPDVASLVVPRRAASEGWIRDASCASTALRLELGERDYRRSEESWAEAGQPTATVLIGIVGDELEVDIDVRTPTFSFAPPDRENPFDNESPDIDGAGLQLYFAAGTFDFDPVDAPDGWVLSLDEGAGCVRARAVAGHACRLTPRADWRRIDGGWAMRVRIPADGLVGADDESFRLGLIVNHTMPGRERRAGQLVLGGAAGEWIYLRGDRHPANRFLPFRLANV